jgi:hypothetical protein
LHPRGSEMKRDQQIRRVLQLIAPPIHRQAEYRRDIEAALKKIDWQAKAAHAFRIATSKTGKAQVNRYAKALKRTRNAYNAIDQAIRPWFSIVEAAYIVGEPTLFDREIDVAEAFLDRPSARPRPQAKRNEIAVDAACDLLVRWGQQVVTTRGSTAEQLAKILAGNLNVDLFDHLRKSKRRLSRTTPTARDLKDTVSNERRR